MRFDQQAEGVPTITREGQPIPVIAFFGAQGGVGKTTIARLCGELITAAPGKGGASPKRAHD